MNSLINPAHFLLQSIKNNLKKKLWRKANLKWTLRSGLIVSVESWAEWVIYNDIFVDGEYDTPIKKVLASMEISKNLNILDLGANVGFFTLRLAHMIFSNYPQTIFHVTLVEGSPKVFEILKSRMNENIMLQDKISIYKGLVGRLNGSAMIFESEFHAMNSIFISNLSKGTKVDYVNLNKLCPAREIDLLKLDVEGSELEFFENYPGLLQKTKYAVIELHHDKCNTTKCLDLLKKAGFSKNMRLRNGPAYSVEFFWKTD